MKLLDLLNAPWAIIPERLAEILAIYATHLRGEEIDIQAVEARLGRPLSNEQQAYTVRPDGVAVLPIEGVLAPKANLFTQISGGASSQMLQQQVESAMVDPRVKGLVLTIDSPGGSVFGTPELADAVRAFASQKQVVAVSEGTMASAAYWIGSAANAVFASGPTVHVGSIGVAMAHRYDPRGANVTEITAGKYKRIASDNRPLTEEGRAHLQERVDHIYSVFVDAVAANRGVTSDQVLAQMADGRVFIGQQALDAGLIDGFASVDDVAEQMAADAGAYAKRRRAVMRKPMSTSPKGATAMDRNQLETEHPALFAELRSTFLAEGAAAGALAERERIQAVEQALIPGHEALIASLKFDGKTTGGDAALAVNAAERELRVKAGAAHRNDAPTPAAAAAAPTVERPSTTDPMADTSRPVEERCKDKWDSDPQTRAEFGSLENFVAWSRASESGRVRVLNKRAA